MSLEHYDLQTIALQTVFDNLADCDYRLGDRIISGTVVIWVSKNMDIPYNEHDDNPSFFKKASNQMLWDILKKLSIQYWSYFKQIEQEKVERFNTPKTSLESTKSLDQVKITRKKILNILETLDTNNGIEFIAILIIEWARRFNANNFLEFVQQNNPTHYEDLKNDSDIIVETLYYMDIYFQLA